jgi:predicted DNA-binding protein YlxM (UPF0122 family)
MLLEALLNDLMNFDRKNIGGLLDPIQFENVKRKVELGIIGKQVRKLNKDGELLDDDSIAAENFETDEIEETFTHIVLTKVTQDLEREGLWKEAWEEIAFSRAFPLTQVNPDQSTYYESEGVLEPDPDIDEESSDDPEVTYDPDGDLYGLEEMTGELDFDAPSEDPDEFVDSPQDGFSEEVHEGVEVAEEVHLMVPKLAQPPIHNIMRRRPWSLLEGVARRMVETNFFKPSSPYYNLLPAACFFSKGIVDKDLFKLIWDDVYKDGRFHVKGKQFSFDEYQNDLRYLKPLLKDYLKTVYVRSRWLRTVIRTYLKSRCQCTEDGTNELLDSYWSRFESTWASLTTKQENALELIYIDFFPKTYQEAADQLQISRESFQDRIRGAVRKFYNVFPELKFLRDNTNPIDFSSSNLISNGLFRKDSSFNIYPLYRLSGSDKRDLITPRKGRVLQRKKSPDLASVKAFAYLGAPVPDLKDTDFFLGLFPKMFFARLKGQSYFEGARLSKQIIYREVNRWVPFVPKSDDHRPLIVWTDKYLDPT